jgi:hypothetical protein
MLHSLMGFTNLAENTLKDWKQYVPDLQSKNLYVQIGSEVIIRPE